MTRLSGLDAVITRQIAIDTGVDYEILWNSESYRKAYMYVCLETDGGREDWDYLEQWVIDNLWDGKW